MGDLLQAARANAVHAFLVLLDLLKGQTEAISQVGLTEPEHQASHADAATDLLVDQYGRLLSPPMHRMLIRPRFDDHGQPIISALITRLGLDRVGLACRTGLPDASSEDGAPASAERPLAAEVSARHRIRCFRLGATGAWAGLLPPPALGERRHRSLARRLPRASGALACDGHHQMVD